MKQKMTLAQRVNILRAGVMGANDGILSVAGIVVGSLVLRPTVFRF